MKRLFKDCSCCGTYMRIDVDDKLYIRLKLMGLIHEEQVIYNLQRMFKENERRWR